jgi:hypothetical protein
MAAEQEAAVRDFINEMQPTTLERSRQRLELRKRRRFLGIHISVTSTGTTSGRSTSPACSRRPVQPGATRDRLRAVSLAHIHNPVPGVAGLALDPDAGAFGEADGLLERVD